MFTMRHLAYASLFVGTLGLIVTIFYIIKQNETASQSGIEEV